MWVSRVSRARGWMSVWKHPKCGALGIQKLGNQGFCGKSQKKKGRGVVRRGKSLFAEESR